MTLNGSARRAQLATALLLTLIAAPGTSLGALSVLNSPHNLSASGGSGKHKVSFTQEKRVCVFCHAPHNANNAGPLWGRGLPSQTTYKPYVSTTLKATPKPDKPTGSSRLCLSCHDGTIALGLFAGSTLTSGLTMPSDVNPTRNPNLTTDLSDDHPISFTYNDALAANQGELAYPETLPPQIKLESGSLLQCMSCHDPHNNEFGNFLVMSNTVAGAPLCTSCHKNKGWGSSSHNPANTPGIPNACLNCHYVHSAPQPARLLQNVKEEDNCLASCHNGTGPSSQNVKPLFDPTMHRHPVDLATGVHDESEQLPAQTYHIECVDCHNPHQANSSGMPLSNPPNINGTLVGVKKDSTGAPATWEYEICFKCHAGAAANKFAGVNEVRPNRVINEPDEQKRFDGGNPSFHPVMAQRRGNGASLLTNLQSSMLTIYCSNCHNSDQSVVAGGAGPSGPHGSRYQHILMARYDMPLPQPSPPSYSASLYDLCYRCHAETYIMGLSSGFVNRGSNEHRAHVINRGIPCFVCHDPHGVSPSSIPAATVQNNSHLINFNRDYTVGTRVANPLYNTTAPRSGNCTVNCHTFGSTHSYSP